jgi:hypothetical protein
MASEGGSRHPSFRPVLMGLRPTNRNETKVGQDLSPVQMWGRRSRLPIPVSDLPIPSEVFYPHNYPIG